MTRSMRSPQGRASVGVLLSWATWLAIAVVVGTIPPLHAQTPPPAASPLKGRVINGSTQKPVAGGTVQRVLLQQGMVPAGEATTDREGRFQFAEAAEGGSGPVLLRVEYQGATYSQPVMPGQTPPEGVEVQVFDAANDPKLVSVKEQAILLHPTGNSLVILEQVFISNTSNPPRAYVNPKGTYLFSLPKAAKSGVQVTVEGPGGMPIGQEAVARNQENGYAVTYPIRPGETQFRLQYSLDYQPPQEFSKSLDMPAEQTHFVTPGKEVELTGDGLQALPPDPASGFVGYQVTPVANVVRAQVTGQAAERSGTEASQAEEGSGSLAPIQTPISRQKWLILAIAGAALLAGFIYLYRR